MSIDIILPCFNPPSDWIDEIDGSYKRFKEEFKDLDIGLIIVDDGSSQLNSEDVHHLKSRIPDLHWHKEAINKGKGAALRKGVALSKADYVIFTDIDFPYTFDSLLSLSHRLLDNKQDIVVGYRPESYYNSTPGQRKRVSKLLRWVNKNIFRLPVSDTQCGLKGFNIKGKKAFLETTINRYLFDLEFLMIATKKNHKLKVSPQEVTLREGVIFSTLNTWIYLTEIGNIFKLFIKKFF